MQIEKLRRYEKIKFLGEGQFATVYKARDRESGKIIAVKKIKFGNRNEAADGINRTALREVKLLQELKHPNIITLVDVFGHGSNISLVYDFMDTDLEKIIHDRENVVLTASHIKAYMIMILTGLEYLHANWILHRDLKPNNLLIDERGVLKLGDFGLAKFYGSPRREMTNQVVTMWYRSPELLYGARMYATGVDIWAVGCIFAELLKREPFLPGESELGQLNKIFEVFGTPSDNWIDAKLLPAYIPFEPQAPKQLKSIFTAATVDTLALLDGMLQLDPCKRLTAAEALNMEYFKKAPGPTPCEELPLINKNKMEAKMDTLKVSDKGDTKRKLSDETVGQNLKKKLNF